MLDPAYGSSSVPYIDGFAVPDAMQHSACSELATCSRSNGFECAGERIQLHRQGSVCKYISRRAIDHGERSAYNVLNLVVQQQLSTEACILDGEMIVWNKTKCVLSCPAVGVHQAAGMQGCNSACYHSGLVIIAGHGRWWTDSDL